MDSSNATVSQNSDKATFERKAQPRKRLFVFCDGTWQDSVNKKSRPTNVATLARCLEGIADDNCIQTVHYDSGVGNATGTFTRLIDGATGRGISDKIRNSYSFIFHNYNFVVQNDEIFLVGFSRGAFAVQCLASFISQTGLFRKEHLYYLRGMFTLWEHQKFRRMGSRQGSHRVEKKLEDHVSRFRDLGLLHKVKIKACVVWDTVRALGSPAPWPRPLSFVGKQVPEAVENAFQILALDETRAQFKPCIWNSKESEETHVKQCWFLGSHTDAGGTGDAALGAVTLIWTIGQLQAHTNATFKQSEVVKHLRYRYLEWGFRVNELLGQFKETAILSDMPSLGRMTTPSWFWWLSGFKTRTQYLLQPDNDCPKDFRLVHFTVRFAMAEGRNKCKILKRWKTTAQDDGTVCWRWREEALLEDRVCEKQDYKECKEYIIFEAWRDGDPLREQTDRSAFTTYVQGVRDEEADWNLEIFVSLLRGNLQFTGSHLAPQTMYSP